MSMNRGSATRRGRWVLLAALALAAPAAFAGATQIFEHADLGIRLTWERGASLARAERGEDVVLEGERGGARVVVVVRKGQALGETQNEFRLMSYFPGEWRKVPEACRGEGWEACAAWTWASESGKWEGYGMSGTGPSGTYLVVVAAAPDRLDARRPALLAIQASVQLF